MTKPNKSNGNKGFSLVELIVVVAIMAVLIAVLAPSLLSYVERSRAQKDESAMGEVTNAFTLALSDSDVYDAVLEHSVKGNVSCYIDNESETAYADQLVELKAGEDINYQYMFNDEARQLDETSYWAGGNMRGVTITLEPTDGVYTLSEGIINKYMPTNNTTKLSACQELYDAVKAIVEDEVKPTSQTYRNSEYTIFIRMGSMAGVDIANQEALQVYGQYNGTNLPAVETTRKVVSGRTTGNDDTSDTTDQPVSVEQLQERYEFEYYSTLAGAVNDVNDGAIGVNADANKYNAVAGIYTDGNGAVSVVLLQDSTEAKSIKPTVDMTINLGGHTLSSNGSMVINCSGGHTTIDGRIQGSTVKLIRDGDARGIQVKSGCALTIIGGSYIVNTTDATTQTRGIYISSGSTVNISDATITTTATSDSDIKCTAICSFSSVLNVSGCRIITTLNSSMGACSGVNDNDSVGIVLSNCTIIANCNYGDNISSVGVYSSNVTLKNCYVSGTHSGVNANGTVNIDGGVYEGYMHGGVYFCGESTTSYVKNATIRECAMPDEYTSAYDGGGAGLYIGGNVDQDSIVVYMDNCDIYGGNRQIVLRGTDGETNNALYISNSTLHDLNGNDIRIRIDNNTHRLYIGVGNNFTIDNAMTLGSNPVTNFEEVVFNTNEAYMMN